jgi:hypothetical protein
MAERRLLWDPEELNMEADWAEKFDRVEDCRLYHAWLRSGVKQTLARDPPYVLDHVEQLALGNPDQAPDSRLCGMSLQQSGRDASLGKGVGATIGFEI